MRPCLGNNLQALGDICREWTRRKSHNTLTCTHRVFHRVFHRTDSDLPKFHNLSRSRRDWNLQVVRDRLWTSQKCCATLRADRLRLLHRIPHRYGYRRKACCRWFLRPRQGRHGYGKILNRSLRILPARTKHGWCALHLDSPDFSGWSFLNSNWFWLPLGLPT